jgi:hypothetical protein
MISQIVWASSPVGIACDYQIEVILAEEDVGS